MYNTDRIAEIRQRCEAATPGPWEWSNVAGEFWVEGSSPTIDVAVGTEGEGIAVAEQDADFIAHSREDIPYLLDRLAQAESKNAELMKQVVGLAQESVRRDLALAKLEAEVERLDVEVDTWMKLQAKTESDKRRLREAQRWIPVGERLPDPTHKVILLRLGGMDQPIIEIGRHNGCDWIVRGKEVGRVTHWMPLPTPPQEGETP